MDEESAILPPQNNNNNNNNSKRDGNVPLYEKYGAISMTDHHTNANANANANHNAKSKYNAAVTLTPRSAKRVNQRTGFVGYLPNLSPFFQHSSQFLKKRSPSLLFFRSNSFNKAGTSLKKTSSFQDIMDSVSDRFTLVGSSFNLCSATLGAGVLSLPYAFKQCGIVVAVVLLIAAGVSTSISVSVHLLCIVTYMHF